MHMRTYNTIRVIRVLRETKIRELRVLRFSSLVIRYKYVYRYWSVVDIFVSTARVNVILTINAGIVCDINMSSKLCISPHVFCVTRKNFFFPKTNMENRFPSFRIHHVIFYGSFCGMANAVFHIDSNSYTTGSVPGVSPCRVVGTYELKWIFLFTPICLLQVCSIRIGSKWSLRFAGESFDVSRKTYARTK